MMNRKSRLPTLTSLLMLVPLLAMSQSNQVSGKVTISEIRNWTGGGNESLLIYVSPPQLVNPAGCEHADYYFYDDSGSDIARSMILAARTSSTPVEFVLWGGGCSASNRPTIVAVTY